MIKVPKNCMVCGADWVGGCAKPEQPFPEINVRVFYECGASISVQANDGWGNYLVLVKNCGIEMIENK